MSALPLCVCGFRLRQIDGYLTCDDPACDLCWKEVDVGWRVLGSGPHAHVGKTFWASECDGYVEANRRCAVNLDWTDRNRTGRGGFLAIGMHQKLRMVRRYRYRKNGQWRLYVPGVGDGGAIAPRSQAASF
jgi:hypothetical protein